MAPWRGRTLGEVLAELQGARTEWVDWLEGLSGEEFFRRRWHDGEDWSFDGGPVQVQWEHDAEHAEQIADWRKHNRLQGFMQELWEARTPEEVKQSDKGWNQFNCVPLYLSKEDLDMLEEQIKTRTDRAIIFDAVNGWDRERWQQAGFDYHRLGDGKNRSK